MDKLQLEELIEKFNSGTISDAQLRILKEYMTHADAEIDLDLSISEESEIKEPPPPVDKRTMDRVFANIWSTLDKDLVVVHLKQNRIWLKVLSGCAAVLLLSFGIYFLYNKGILRNNGHQVASGNEIPILPGGDRAKLLLEDGSTIDLSSLSDDTLINLGKYAIRKDKQGGLSYVVGSTVQDPEKLFNTIITPKGGNYKLNLPDGTKIWVNSNSRLHYPLILSGKKREVELTGEAYFEVAKLSKAGRRVPFIVHTGQQVLEVLGTTFNINSYSPQIQTTLVEGKIRLSYPKTPEQIILPNQQAVYSPESGKLSVRHVDPYYITAWKDGTFAFDNTPVSEVMQTLARWYNVEVTYQTDVHALKFTGTLSKYEQIEQILKVIELTNTINFKIEGRRIIVM